MFNANMVALQTIVRKEWRRFTRIWLQTLLPPAVTMALYFLIFGALIGARIGEIAGFSYMAFVIPGLIMMSVINNSYSNVASSFFSAKYNKSIEELLVSSTPNWVIVLGWVLGGALRGLCVAVIVSMVALFFAQLPWHQPLLMVLVVILAAVLFALAGLINAIFASSFDDVSVVPTFVLTPLTYLGGVFYSIDMLPGFWRDLSLFNPVLYLVNAFRYAILGVSDVNIVHALLGMLLAIVVLAGFALYMMAHSKRLRH
ncbi:ABC transporter permease [Agaribacterium haliotis]|uniref:ABC transporter permease n=1 Tax=Agaribacterium haliotis TaxID=2013869 RepID=UPI000BB57B78|nr:ABC transporter permease [Agaribacterium haliotis]